MTQGEIVAYPYQLLQLGIGLEVGGGSNGIDWLKTRVKGIYI